MSSDDLDSMLHRLSGIMSFAITDILWIICITMGSPGCIGASRIHALACCAQLHPKQLHNCVRALHICLPRWAIVVAIAITLAAVLLMRSIHCDIPTLVLFCNAVAGY